MNRGILIGLGFATILAIMTLFYFVHPVLVLTLTDVFWMIIFDVGIAFCLALYLGYNKSQERVVFWTIIGSICLFIPIIASVIKYNREKKQK